MRINKTMYKFLFINFNQSFYFLKISYFISNDLNLCFIQTDYDNFYFTSNLNLKFYI